MEGQFSPFFLFPDTTMSLLSRSWQFSLEVTVILTIWRCMLFPSSAAAHRIAQHLLLCGPLEEATSCSLSGHPLVLNESGTGAGKRKGRICMSRRSFIHSSQASGSPWMWEPPSEPQFHYWLSYTRCLLLCGLTLISKTSMSCFKHVVVMTSWTVERNTINVMSAILSALSDR